MTDSDRIDFLERFINDNGAVLLHDGSANTHGHLGIGLRPGLLNRNLREAIDQCATLRSHDGCCTGMRMRQMKASESPLIWEKKFERID